MRYRISVLAMLWLTTTCAAAESYPPMPEAFSSFGAAVSDGYVYVYGGHIARTHNYSTEAVTGKFRRLSLSQPSKGWEELPAGPAVQGLALVAHGGKLYRIGGMQPRNKPGDPSDNHSLATCAVYDPEVGKWAPMADLPAPRSSHDAAVSGDQIVVVGGWHMKGASGKTVWHDDTLVLDLSQKEPRWQSIPQPFKRRALNVAALGGKVYVVCGMTWENEIEKSVDVLDLKTRTWSTGPTLPGPVLNGFTPAACTSGGTIYVNPNDGKVYRLNDRKSGWDTVAALEPKRQVHRIVPLGGDRLLVLGGGTKTGNLARVDVVEPARSAKSAAASPVRAGVQEFCPIMTTVPLDEESREVEYQGAKIKVCCSTCVKKWRAEPEAYLNVSLLPQLKGMKLPERKIAQVYCPVYTDRVVSSKDPSATYNGITVYFFNETAKARFLADPLRYANARILPQLQSSRN